MEIKKKSSKLVCAFAVVVHFFLFAVVASQDKALAQEILGAAEVKEAYSLLQTEDFKGALQKTKRAIEVNPKLPDAWFLAGFAFNRLHMHAKALVSLQHARKLGVSGSPLDYEIGWAAVFLGKWDVATEYLGRYDAAKPGSGGVSVSLGMALLGQGKLDEAEVRLREAVERDPGRKASALFLLSQIEGARGNLPAARKHIQQLMVETPDSRLGRTLWGGLALKKAQEAQAEAGTTQQPQKPWHFTLSTSGGYNNNVIALGEGLPLPTDVSSKASPFYQVALSTRYDSVLTSASSMNFGYSLNSNIYTDVDEFDSLDHYLYARYAKRIQPDLAVFLTASQQFTFIDGDYFRGEFALNPSLLYRWNENASLEFSYRFGSSNYRSVTVPVLDRDANANTLAVTGYFKVPDTDISWRLGYFYLDSDTHGANYESHGSGMTVGVSSLLAWQVVGEVNYTRTVYSYENPDVFSADGAVRGDSVDRLTLRLSRPVMKQWSMMQGLSAYIRYDHINNASNVPLFNYDQTQGSAGLVAEF